MSVRALRSLQKKIQLRDYQNKQKKPSPKKYSGSCPICFCCLFIKHGFYKRYATDDDGLVGIERIQRYQCKTTKRTFSILPENLIPYRTYSLGLLVKVWKLILSLKRSQHQMVSAVMERLPALCNISYPQIQDMLSILEIARDRFTVLTGESFESLSDFFQYCQDCEYEDRCDIMAAQSAVYAHHSNEFLFGIPSQDR